MQHLTGQNIPRSKHCYVYIPRSITKATKSLPDWKTAEKIVFSISGINYETFATTLNKYPETLLGTAEKRSKLFTDSRRIFLNRSHVAFESILFFYQSSGNLLRPQCIPMKDFVDECYFYDIPDKAVNRMKTREAYLCELKVQSSYVIEGCYVAFKKSIERFFDSPKESSGFAVLYFFWSYLLILLSVAVICVESELLLNYDGVLLQKYLNICWRIETNLNVYFALEFLLRLYANPVRLEFMIRPLNVIELLSTGLYLTVAFLPKHLWQEIFLNFSRCLRGIRLARASRLSSLIKTAASVFILSIYDIIAVAYILLIVSVLYGSVMYYIEMSDVDTKFTCIPDSMWWALQTVICLGYGDITPTTTAGKLVGTVLMTIGVIIMTVLLLSLGGRFFDTYSKELYQKEFIPHGEEVDLEIHYERTHQKPQPSNYKGYKTPMERERSMESAGSSYKGQTPVVRKQSATVPVACHKYFRKSRSQSIQEATVFRKSRSQSIQDATVFRKSRSHSLQEAFAERLSLTHQKI